MGRAFSPQWCFAFATQAVGLGWYGDAPLARKNGTRLEIDLRFVGF